MFAYGRDDDKGLAIMSRHRYPIEACRVFERTSFTKLKMELTSVKSVDDKEPTNFDESGGDAHEKSKETSKNSKNSKNKNAHDANKKLNDGARTNKSTLKTLLGDALNYGPALSEHIILDAGLIPNMKVGNSTDSQIDEDSMQALAKAVAKFEDWLADVISGQKVPEGYILMQSKATGKKENIPLSEPTLDKVRLILF